MAEPTSAARQTIRLCCGTNAPKSHDFGYGTSGCVLCSCSDANSLSIRRPMIRVHCPSSASPTFIRGRARDFTSNGDNASSARLTCGSAVLRFDRPTPAVTGPPPEIFISEPAFSAAPVHRIVRLASHSWVAATSNGHGSQQFADRLALVENEPRSARVVREGLGRVDSQRVVQGRQHVRGCDGPAHRSLGTAVRLADDLTHF